jgi:hypothetical protein
MLLLHEHVETSMNCFVGPNVGAWVLFWLQGKTVQGEHQTRIATVSHTAVCAHVCVHMCACVRVSVLLCLGIPLCVHMCACMRACV